MFKFRHASCVAHKAGLLLSLSVNGVLLCLNVTFLIALLKPKKENKDFLIENIQKFTKSNMYIKHCLNTYLSKFQTKFMQKLL